ncbi:hypothetical protein INR49_003802 [Caranx melampygus]|nr:hypothetical protein INR49_003802 [Caranx melampygus]
MQRAASRSPLALTRGDRGVLQGEKVMMYAARCLGMCLSHFRRRGSFIKVFHQKQHCVSMSLDVLYSVMDHEQVLWTVHTMQRIVQTCNRQCICREHVMVFDMDIYLSDPRAETLSSNGHGNHVDGDERHWKGLRTKRQRQEKSLSFTLLI